MNGELEKKVYELEKKVSKLERIEKVRKIKILVGLIIKLIIVGICLYTGYRYYQHINETYIKPYKETIDKLDSGYDKIKNSTIFSKLFG